MNAHTDDEPDGRSRVVSVLRVLKLLLTVLVLALTLLRALSGGPL
ncbi:uncharacterized protein HHUB_3223 [Halobacterium hubeiense]|uniref:Uncharacterized protein n=2 Tax=Halobacterium TaxID=2239 RepID=A0A0U5H6D0_9EURY|nr:hypothetical protein [Halobacterium hubeiense]CQH60492.1 uncharacterized protein HHUB_3223 [Halobacterium hubeiense]